MGHPFHTGLMVSFCLCEMLISQEFSFWFCLRDLLTPYIRYILNLCKNPQNMKENKVVNICKNIEIGRNCSVIKKLFHRRHCWCFLNEDYRTGLETSYNRNGKLQLSRHLAGSLTLVKSRASDKFRIWLADNFISQNTKEALRGNDAMGLIMMRWMGTLEK